MAMNERIKEFAKQAGFYKYGDDFEDIIEKFAELIVKECISIAQDRAAFDWAPPNDVNHIINEIKEHFGIE
jgi:hypothetical protein